jgi:hypothetical protein
VMSDVRRTAPAVSAEERSVMFGERQYARR